MKIYIQIVTVAICIIAGVNHISAQVSIGEGKETESFSVLQLDGVEGGLRLPQLTQTQALSLKTELKALLSADKADTKGLVIYNTEKNEIEYWDGDDWVVVGGTVTFDNGLIKNTTTNSIELGGALIENTNINIKDNKLSFTSGTSTKWAVNNTLFEVINGAVSITPASLNIKTDAVSIVKGEDVKLNRIVSISNDNNELTIDNGVVTIKGQLRYEDKNKANGKVLTAGYSGRAYWNDLRSSITRVNGTLKANNTPINGTGGTTDINSTPLVLTPGKWLIFAKITARTTASTRMHLWLNLRNNAEPTKIICNVGGDVDINGYSTPQFTYFMTVHETSSYNLVVTTSNNPTQLISNTTYGTPYFYAILIDEPQIEN